MSAPFIPTCPPQPPFPGTGRIPAATPEPVIPPVPGRIPPTPPVVTVNGVRPDADGDVHIPIVDATAVRIVEQDLTEEQKTTARSNIGIPDVLSSKADLEDGKVPSSQLPDPAVVDSTVTETSSNAVKSSGIWTWVKGLLPSWLTSSFPQPITSHQDLSGIEDELAEKVVAAEVTEYRSDITLTSGGASAIHLFSSEPNPVPAQIDLAKSYVEGGYDSSVTLGTDSGVPAVIVKWKASSSARLYNSFCVYGNGSASRTISGTKTTAEYSFVQYTGKDTTVAPKANALTAPAMDAVKTAVSEAISSGGSDLNEAVRSAGMDNVTVADEEKDKRVAVGVDADASGDAGESANTRYQSVAIGREAKATSASSVAVGPHAEAIHDEGESEQCSVAVGYRARTNSSGSVAIGSAAGQGLDASSPKSTGENSVAIGRFTSPQAEHSVAIGQGASVAPDAISAVQIGSGENTEAYSLKFRGTTLVEDSRVPVGSVAGYKYRRLDKLHFSDGQYIDTGVKVPNGDFTLKMKCTLKRQSSYRALYGCRNGSSAQTFCAIVQISSTEVLMDCGTRGNYRVQTGINKELSEFDLTASVVGNTITYKYSYDGKTYTTKSINSDGSPSNGLTILVGALNNSSNKMTGYDGDVYSFSIENASGKIIDLVPFDANGVIGMLDTVSGKMFVNANTEVSGFELGDIKAAGSLEDTIDQLDGKIPEVVAPNGSDVISATDARAISAGRVKKELNKKCDVFLSGIHGIATSGDSLRRYEFFIGCTGYSWNTTDGVTAKCWMLDSTYNTDEYLYVSVTSNGVLDININDEDITSVITVNDDTVSHADTYGTVDSVELVQSTDNRSMPFVSFAATGLTQRGEQSLFSGDAFRKAAFGTSASSAVNMETGRIATVDGSSGGTIEVTFKSNEEGDTSLRCCELLVTGVSGDGAVTIALPSGTYQFAEGADSTVAGNNHFIFSEYQSGKFFVSRITRTEQTV